MHNKIKAMTAVKIDVERDSILNKNEKPGGLVSFWGGDGLETDFQLCALLYNYGVIVVLKLYSPTHMHTVVPLVCPETSNFGLIVQVYIYIYRP